MVKTKTKNYVKLNEINHPSILQDVKSMGSYIKSFYHGDKRHDIWIINSFEYRIIAMRYDRKYKNKIEIWLLN
jgi:hypothetical protein